MKRKFFIVALMAFIGVTLISCDTNCPIRPIVNQILVYAPDLTSPISFEITYYDNGDKKDVLVSHTDTIVLDKDVCYFKLCAGGGTNASHMLKEHPEYGVIGITKLSDNGAFYVSPYTYIYINGALTALPLKKSDETTQIWEALYSQTKFVFLINDKDMHLIPGESAWGSYYDYPTEDFGGGKYPSITINQ